MSLLLMAMERALGLAGRHLVRFKYFGLLTLFFMIIPLLFAAPVFIPSFPVRVYRFRYLCAIGSRAPIAFSLIQVLIYGGCLFVILLCFGTLLKHRNNSGALPVKQQDYGA